MKAKKTPVKEMVIDFTGWDAPDITETNKRSGDYMEDGATTAELAKYWGVSASQSKKRIIKKKAKGQVESGWKHFIDKTGARQPIPCYKIKNAK